VLFSSRDASINFTLCSNSESPFFTLPCEPGEPSNQIAIGYESITISRERERERERREGTPMRELQRRGIAASGNQARCNRCVGVLETRDWNRYFRSRFHRSFLARGTRDLVVSRHRASSFRALPRGRPVPLFRSALAMPRFYSRARIARCVGVCVSHRAM